MEMTVSHVQCIKLLIKIMVSVTRDISICIVEQFFYRMI